MSITKHRIRKNSRSIYNGDRSYISKWIEEGIEKDEITNDYSYDEKILIKDKAGNLISEEVGALTQFPDGKWRIS